MGRAFIVAAVLAMAAELVVAVVVIGTGLFGSVPVDTGAFQGRPGYASRPIVPGAADEQSSLARAGSAAASAFAPAYTSEEIRRMRGPPEETPRMPGQAQGERPEVEAPPQHGAPAGKRWPVALAGGRSRRVHHVSMANFKFTPETLQVHVGDTIEWDNTDFVLHTATADDQTFDTGDVRASEMKRVIAETKGRFPYVCRYHNTMKGLVIVE